MFALVTLWTLINGMFSFLQFPHPFAHEQQFSRQLFNHPHHRTVAESAIGPSFQKLIAKNHAVTWVTPVACTAPVSCDSRVVSMKTLKVIRSAGGGGMQSISKTSWPAAICADGFSAGLKLAVPATSAPRPIRMRIKLLTLARMLVISAFEIGWSRNCIIASITLRSITSIVRRIGMKTSGVV